MCQLNLHDFSSVSLILWLAVFTLRSFIVALSKSIFHMFVLLFRCFGRFTCGSTSICSASICMHRHDSPDGFMSSKPVVPACIKPCTSHVPLLGSAHFLQHYNNFILLLVIETEYLIYNKIWMLPCGLIFLLCTSPSMGAMYCDYIQIFKCDQQPTRNFSCG